MTTEQERHERIEMIGKTVFDAARALEGENWTRLEQLAKEIGRQARVLTLLDQREPE